MGATRSNCHFDLKTLTTIENFDHKIILLNGEGNIEYANKCFTDWSSGDGLCEYMDRSIGHALGCVCTVETGLLCGTTIDCEECSVQSAIVQAREDKSKIRVEKNFFAKRGGVLQSIDIELSVCPFIFEDDELFLVEISDIAAIVKDRLFKRTFLHDMRATLANIYSITDVSPNLEHDEISELHGLLNKLSSYALDQLNYFESIEQIESGTFSPSISKTKIKDIIELSTLNVGYNTNLPDLNICIDCNCSDSDIWIDKTIITRVISNMLTNALENGCGQQIILRVIEADTTFTFSVWNAAVIPVENQSQIFKRMFSTKGQGHGVGTYSMKLLTKCLLGGDISFCSQTSGTEFFVSIPSGFPNPAQA